ncbi:MAG: hypothetical protein H7067_07420 [Burkholderiales bacterium]|nr:hypothetical protein [Opitutaceae bacterium]
MKPLKLLACLVTLQLTSGLTLQAADQQELRQWTDINGRSISARLVEAPNADSVKIEREDGRVFTVALKTFSAADQAFVNTWRTEQEDIAAGRPVLKEPDAATWTLLNAGGQQPASTYSKTRLDEILEVINQRFVVKAVKTASGQPLVLRTEPADLAARVQFSGDMPRMSLQGFVQTVAQANDLAVKIDRSGMLVLVDKPQTSSADSKQVASFFGVPMNTP